ncbi:hypothetical protein BDQ17DRAFT_1424917 [Cyathus striatus]|nr:hypothetical protein BDQ17DRAFT_1424917 [Cyathus striatus]
MAPRSVPEWTIVDFIYRGHWWTNHGLQILPDWQEYFHHPEGKILGVINSAQGIGCLFVSFFQRSRFLITHWKIQGLPLAPFVSDTWGRRASLFIGSLFMLAGVALQATSWNIAMYIASRIVIGFGLTFCTNSAPLLLIELAYPTQRGKITSIYNSSWYLGSIVSAWVCFGSYVHAQGSMWSWRVPTLVQALVPLLQVSLVWFIPESPRFLVSKGLEGRAAHILAKYHANGGDERDPLVVFEIAQIRHALRMEDEIHRIPPMFHYSLLPGTERMRIIIAIAVFSQWRCVQKGDKPRRHYVGRSGNETKAAINGGLQIFNFVVAASAAMLVDWVGRRTLFIISNAGMFLFFSGWTVSNALYNALGKVAAARATIPLIFFFYFFYDIAYTPMLVAYTLEILPYKIRAKGFAVMNLTVMLTSAFNQFVNPWAIDAIGWWYYIVYCAWLIIELVFIVVFIIETKGRTLEETAALFDGEEQQQDLAIMGGDAATMTMTMSRGILVHQEVHTSKSEGEYHELRVRHSSTESKDSDIDPEIRRISYVRSP